MSYRYMRLVVMFDLPVESSEERREYARFRKFLIKNGFVMLQESIYTKILLNNTVADRVKENVRANKTKKGLIQLLCVTERQFEKMEIIVGDYQNEVINNDERMIIL